MGGKGQKIGGESLTICKDIADTSLNRGCGKVHVMLESSKVTEDKTTNSSVDSSGRLESRKRTTEIYQIANKSQHQGLK